MLGEARSELSNITKQTTIIIIIIKALFNLEKNLSAFIKNAGLNKMSSNKI